MCININPETLFFLEKLYLVPWKEMPRNIILEQQTTVSIPSLFNTLTILSKKKLPFYKNIEYVYFGNEESQTGKCYEGHSN